MKTPMSSQHWSRQHTVSNAADGLDMHGVIKTADTTCNTTKPGVLPGKRAYVLRLHCDYGCLDDAMQL